jgi:2-polyprenyl-6-methoxyphenol hydroxylase-like FAD-dependent oxidoreductase
MALYETLILFHTYILFSKNNLIMDVCFLIFYTKNNVAIAVFENGETEYGDIFIGADGSNSKVRESLFGKVNFTPVAVHEIVGISKTSHRRSRKSCFSEIPKQNQRFMFGFIPASCNESVWFMQYDVKLASGDEGKALKRFKNFAMTCLPISLTKLDVSTPMISALLTYGKLEILILCLLS